MPLERPDDAISYLLRRGLLTPDHAAGADVRDVSRRNRNFEVVTPDGPSYLLKQGVDDSKAAGIAREGLVYERLQGDGESSFARFLPRSHGYDAAEQVLVLELVRDAEDLRAYHQRVGRSPRGVATKLGEALASLHSLSLAEGVRGDVFEGPPLALSIHRPALRSFWEMSAGNVQLLRTIQRVPEFDQHLDRLRQDWQPSAFIHYDLRWDNCLLDRHRADRLKIIDWEFAGRGDPRWDVGAALSNYLSFWVLSIPIAGDMSPEELPVLARHPLANMQPAMNAFWQSYRDHMGLAADAEAGWLLRATQYLAVRLLETAYAQTQLSTAVSSHALCLLQLGLNILERPEEAIVYLLGIPLVEGAAA